MIRGSPVPQLFVPRKTLRNNSRVIKKQPQFPIFNSPVVDQSIYVFGGYRSAGSYRVRSGGKGDVTKSHVDWYSRNSSYVATPVHYDGRLYWIDDQGIAWCQEASTKNCSGNNRLVVERLNSTRVKKT